MYSFWQTKINHYSLKVNNLKFGENYRKLLLATTKDLRIIKKASGKNGYVRICEEYAYSALIEVYNRIKSMDDDEVNSGEEVLNKMIKEMENSRS